MSLYLCNTSYFVSSSLYSLDCQYVRMLVSTLLPAMYISMRLYAFCITCTDHAFAVEGKASLTQSSRFPSDRYRNNDIQVHQTKNSVPTKQCRQCPQRLEVASPLWVSGYVKQVTVRCICYSAKLTRCNYDDVDAYQYWLYLCNYYSLSIRVLALVC